MHVSCDNHIGLRTANLDAAARFWCDALGGRLATVPVERSGAAVEAVFGSGAMIKVAQVSFPAGGGIELFEFVEPRSTIPTTEQPRAAIMHFALTVDDIDDALARIDAAGGRSVSEMATVAGAPSGPQFVYCESPEGHTFELVTVEHSAVIDFVNGLRGGERRNATGDREDDS